ncbi:MAG: DUF11 domain-containing protein [Clostridia bacterium]|nr:DUF11 domain-containing protein [Clostridia bacterium]
MATIITNQARLNYRYAGAREISTVFSNTASAILNGQLDIEKTSLSTTYRIGQDITYFITVTNEGNGAVNDVVITDDLGTYRVGNNNYTPLTYIGPSQLLINGVFDSLITPVISNGRIVYNIENLPANATAQIRYIVRVNEFANGSICSQITNTATAVCDCICNEPASDSHTLTAEAFADVRVIKSICPNPVICGEEVNFIFDIYNYGNLEATDVILIDTFNPPITDIEVRVDGVLIPESDYDYVNGVLTLPSPDSDYSITVPPATFTQNPQTGIISIVPGNVRITVSGRI